METLTAFFVQYKTLFTIIHVISVVIGMGACLLYTSDAADE